MQWLVRLLGFGALLLVSATVAAQGFTALPWTGPGWYVVELANDVPRRIHAGPFAARDRCEYQAGRIGFELSEINRFPVLGCRMLSEAPKLN